MRSSKRISPTAYYTGEVWRRNGLAPETFSTVEGSWSYRVLRPFDVAAELSMNISIETVLIERHRMIDHFLTRLVEEEGVTQVLEVAAGLSPRGAMFTERYPQLTYVEADLPGMRQQKAERLRASAVDRERLRLIAADAFVSQGEASLESCVARTLDRTKPLVIITEGLIPYFERSRVDGLWARLAALMGQGGGAYISDIYTRADAGRFVGTRLFYLFLKGITQASLELHFQDAHDATEALRGHFPDVALYDAWSMPKLFPDKTKRRTAVHVAVSRVPPGGAR